MQYELADPTTIRASVFGDEVVIANFATGVYYSLRFSSAELWLGLMAGVPAGQVVEAVTPHCTIAPEMFAKEAWSLIKTLEAAQLIKSANRVADADWAPRPMYRPYEAPASEILHRHGGFVVARPDPRHWKDRVARSIAQNTGLVPRVRPHTARA